MGGFNTKFDIGIRRNIPGLGDRNFETDGVTQYAAAINGLYFKGSLYNVGQTLPYDGGGSPHTFYGPNALALLQFYWNQNFINSLT